MLKVAVANKVVVLLEAQTSKYISDIRAAENEFTGAMKSVEGAAASAESGVTRSLGGISGSLKGLLAGAAIGGVAALGAATAAVVSYGDAWVALGNRLRGVGVSSRDLAGEQQKVVDIAISSRSNLEATNDLYAKLLGITHSLGVDSGQAAIATQAVAKALTLGGVSAGAASGAITQLGQALGSGVLRGDEFNSVMEALGAQSPLIQAIANEFGVTTDQLRGLAEQGELVADRVFKAIIDAGPAIDAAFGNTIPTIAQEFENLQTATTSALGALNDTLGITNTLASAMGVLAGAIQGAAAALRSFNSAEADANIDEIQNVANGQGQRIGTRAFGVGTKQMQDAQRALLAAGVIGGSAGPGSRGGGRRDPGTGKSVFNVPTPTARPQSELGEFNGLLTTDQDVKNRFKAMKPAGGGRKARSSAQKVSEYEKENKKIQEQINKNEALAGSVGDGAAAVAKAKATEDLMNAARDSGIKLTDQEKEKIDKLAQAYADSVQAVEDAKKAHQELVETFNDIRDVADSGIGSFVAGLREGKSAAESLKGALNDMLDTILKIAEKNLLNGLFGDGGGTGIGGLLGPIFSSFFGGGHARGGSVFSNKAYMVGEKGPELFAPGRTGTIVPNSAIMGGGNGAQQNVVINTPPGSSSSKRNEQGPDYQKVIIDIVNEGMGSGRLDGSMRGRFGARPRKVI
jgi:tape measure domain-containing protein